MTGIGRKPAELPPGLVAGSEPGQELSAFPAGAEVPLQALRFTGRDPAFEVGHEFISQEKALTSHARSSLPSSLFMSVP
jgi:hypothetical protein